MLESPWKSISLDFIVRLPKFKDCQTIMVVMDCFSNYAIFIPTMKEAMWLFMKYVVKYWEILPMIVNDRDPRSTRHFWLELFKLLGSNLNFSTSLHP